VTDFAILTHDGIKHPLVDERLRPDVAIIDRTLVKNLPPALIADGGFDVLTHALEAYTASNAGAVTDALARDAIQTTFRQLIHSFRGDQTARGQVHEAATMAGMAFTQAGLGLCHALAHSLGGVFHIPHGRLNAILLPAVIRCNSPSAGEKYAALARAAGLEGRAVSVGVRNLRNAFIRLRRELALPGSLAEAGVSSAQLRKNLDRIIQAALEDPCCKTNPQPVTADMVRSVVQEAAGHG
jgi:alcohol dehydrogenase class IV